MKNIKLHIVMDVVSMWGLILCGLYLGFTGTILYFVFSVPLIIWFSIRTFKWAKILFDVIFSKPQTIITRGFRFSDRHQVYALNVFRNVYYSIIRFSDPGLKGEYICFEYYIFRGGEKLEVTYYKHSRYITSIKRIEEKQA